MASERDGFEETSIIRRRRGRREEGMTPLLSAAAAAFYIRGMIRLFARFVLSVSVIACTTARSPAPHSPVASPKGAKVVAYLASWGVRSKGTRIAELPGDRLTHVIYAFASVRPDGTMALEDPCLDAGQCGADLPPALGGNFQQLRVLKDRHPHLKVLVAVGGWTRSANFSDAALTTDSRRRFAESGITSFIRRWQNDAASPS